MPKFSADLQPTIIFKCIISALYITKIRNPHPPKEQISMKPFHPLLNVDFSIFLQYISRQTEYNIIPCTFYLQRWIGLILACLLVLSNKFSCFLSGFATDDGNTRKLPEIIVVVVAIHCENILMTILYVIKELHKISRKHFFCSSNYNQ